jgi:hypothetical protein
MSVRYAFAPRNPESFVSMASSSLDEGDSGSANMTFTVMVIRAQPLDLQFTYTTENDTATAGQDYTSTSGTGTITAGQTNTTIDVPILGDVNEEDDETFTMRLTNFRWVF